MRLIRGLWYQFVRCGSKDSAQYRAFGQPGTAEYNLAREIVQYWECQCNSRGRGFWRVVNWSNQTRLLLQEGVIGE